MVVRSSSRVTANRVDGVRVSTAAQVAVMRNNLLDHNLRAGAYLGSGTASIGPGTGSLTCFISSAACEPSVNGSRQFCDPKSTNTFCNKGGWEEFPLDTNVSGGIFQTYVQTYKTGVIQWRVKDASTGKISNVVTVRHGE